MNRTIILLTIMISFLALACRKQGFIESPDARIRFSEDTLFFDTVFTKTGSVTQYFTIHNENNQKIRLTSVQLKGGSNSPFKINVDGAPGPEVNNLEIDP